ncbi:AraC-like ligand-binding domain-containing protein [Streptomyces poriticola]|uniref:AraC-like ligand-binding domain-containing protein n=1 Tax=Streptomyces poriticola TaxID=3120506 RepID=UPI002FCE5510
MTGELTKQVFRTDDVPVADRFDSWRSSLARAMVPVEIRSDRGGDFRAEMTLLELGSLRVVSVTTQPMSLHRTSRLIRQSDPGVLLCSLPLHGSLGVSQAGLESVHGPHEMSLIDASLPFDCHVHGGKALVLEIPRALLAVPTGGADRLLTRRIPGWEGVGALLSGFLIRLATDGGAFLPPDGPRLETILADLLSATLAHRLDAGDFLPPETGRWAVAMRVREFIRAHLRDPQLTVQTVAAAHHISTSYLHVLFREEGLTVAAWIRSQRLERSRRDLAEPGTPVQAIAARWGFSHPAAFSRAFRATYGMSPTEYRRAVHCTPAERPRNLGAATGTATP